MTAITISMTRGAAYLLESLLQNPAPHKTTTATARAARLWGFLRRANPIKVDGVDYERSLIKGEMESPESFAQRSQDRNDAFDAWSNETVSLDMNPRTLEIAREVCKWAAANPGKAWNRITDHVASLLTALDLGQDETE